MNQVLDQMIFYKGAHEYIRQEYQSAEQALKRKLPAMAPIESQQDYLYKQLKNEAKEVAKIKMGNYLGVDRQSIQYLFEIKEMLKRTDKQPDGLLA